MHRKKNLVCTRNVDFQLDTDAAQSSDGRTLDGYAAVFNQPTQINSWEGRFDETIEPGAFKKTLQERKPIMQFNHGRDSRMGSAPIGVFDDIKEDGHGLHTVGRLFDHPDVERIRQGIQSGAISGMSFTFNVVRDRWTDKDGNKVSGRELQRLLYDAGSRGPLKRSIKEVRLMEAGPVVYPAYEGTSVGVRSADEVDEEERSQILASYCRTAGLDMPMGMSDDKEPEDDDEEENEDERAAAPLTDLDKDTDGDVNPVADEDMDVNDEEEEDEGTRDAKEPYGSVSYADPGYQKDGKKRYPIDTKEHVQAAWSYINQSKNAGQYSSTQLSSIKSKIKSAAKKFGITISDDESKSSESDDAVRTSETATHGNAAHSTLPEENHNNSARKRMSTINEMQERIAAIEVRMETLGTEYRDGDMPEAEGREFDELTEERTSLLATIEKVQARLDVIKGIASTEPKKVEDKKIGAPAVHRSGVEHDLTEIRNATYSTEGYASAVHDNVMRFIDSKEFKPANVGRHHEEAQERIEDLLNLGGRDDSGKTLAERLLVTGTDTYERAFFKAAQAGHLGNLERDEFRSMQLGSDSAGGYAIPFQLDPTIIWTSPGVINPIRNLARVEQIVGKEFQTVTSAGVTVSRHAEGAVTSDNSFTLAEVSVRTNRVDAFVPFTYEAEQSWQGLRNNISAAILDGKNREEATSFLLGDGTGVNANGLIATLNLTNSPVVSSAASSTLTAANIYNLETALDPRWRTQDAAFLAHRSIYNLIRQFDTAGGAQLWQRIGAGLPNQLLGYDSYESSVMSGAMGTGNKVAVFGNFQQFLIVDRIGMQVELIPNVFDPTTARPTGQRGVFAVWMNNTKVLVDAAFKLLQST